MRPRQSNFWKVFSIPLAIGLVSVMGLFSALLGDDAWDVLSWSGQTASIRSKYTGAHENRAHKKARIAAGFFITLGS